MEHRRINSIEHYYKYLNITIYYIVYIRNLHHENTLKCIEVFMWMLVLHLVQYHLVNSQTLFARGVSTVPCM